MLDFAAVRSGAVSFADMVRGLTTAELHNLTDEMVDLVLSTTAGATDADVVFEPIDRQAQPTEHNETVPGWSLAHVVAHTTAAAEEAAAIAVTLARGVVVNGRFRYEVPWDTIQSTVQLQERIEESRRMRHAFLNAWPNQPNLELTHQLAARFGPLNAVGCFVLGLFHEDAHIEQLREIMRQALAARGT